MNRYFYESKDCESALLQEACSWLGTPFHDHAGVKGAGVDCVHLVAGIYVATGFLSEFKPPPYAIDEGSHAMRSKLIDYIEATGRFEQIRIAPREDGPVCRTCAPPINDLNLIVRDFLPGDLICLTIGRIAFHVGVMLRSGFFLHVYQSQVVAELPLFDVTWHSRLAAIYRPLA